MVELLLFLGQQGGDAEVNQLNLLGLGVNEEVGRFNVFVDDALLVEIAKCFGQLNGDIEKFVEVRERRLPIGRECH